MNFFKKNKQISSKIDESSSEIYEKDQNYQDNAQFDIEDKEEKTTFFEKVRNGLTKTRKNISSKIDDVIISHRKVDEELFDELEEILITADVGIESSVKIIENLKIKVKKDKISDSKEIKELLKEEVKTLMLNSVDSNKLQIDPSPSLILIEGVNGVGKTTTIGKLAYTLKTGGKSVLLAAGDTFRAAAIDQLMSWGSKANVEVVSHQEGADPAAVIFDAIKKAKAKNIDVLICDTAGRLHNKTNLMNELNKIFRVVEREFPEAKKEILLVLDATTGQNAINQAKVFKEVSNITGAILTKLDGTAKGGIAIALQAELNLPIKLIGVGEGIEDLQPFDVDLFVESIFE
ncbi:MAG: signal recognition particle-docking protein FtsY [Tissierellales bacterium]|nr:signal recognition particle-docking protein FtsY [Tissierellales bacterium]